MDAKIFDRLVKLRLALQEDFQKNRDWKIASDSSYDTDRIFSLFDSLRLKPGFCWRLLTSDWVTYSGPYLFAVPTELRRAPLPHKTSGFKDVPGALESPMLAVEGDKSPWSYLTASFLARDADELGAYSTGNRFRDQILLSSCPEVSNFERKPADRTDWGWEWHEPPPQSWWPRVDLQPEQVLVTFYTYKLCYGEAITRYTDRYRPGNYCPECLQKVVARGPNHVMT